jgi:hypothetical protein
VNGTNSQNVCNNCVNDLSIGLSGGSRFVLVRSRYQ